MAADGGRRDLEVVEQLLRLAGVFAGDAVGTAQHIEGAEGDVAKVADGRGDEVEAGGERMTLLDMGYPVCSLRCSEGIRECESKSSLDSLPADELCRC